MQSFIGSVGRRRRVMVVDDSKTMQAVLEQIFSLRLDFDVVGLAADVQSAVPLIRSLRPDLVTIDLHMPYIDGGKLLEEIADLTDVRKIVISGQACSNLRMVSRLEAAGADACIDKRDLSRDPAKFCQKVQAVLARPRTKRTSQTDADRGAMPIWGSVGNAAPYPVPLDERARLAALAKMGLANDDEDQQLDLLTAHLGEITDFPSALMTFIDHDRQWVKSAYGFARGAMPRAHAFCNHTLCAEDTFVVSNAAADPRFARNPLVTDEPRIRTYIGHPITAPDGVRLGAMCLMDSKPRRVTPAVVANLRSVCRIAGEIIALRAPRMRAAA